MSADTAVEHSLPRSGIRDNENLVGVNQIRITDNGTVYTVDIQITDTLSIVQISNTQQRITFLHNNQRI